MICVYLHKPTLSDQRKHLKHKMSVTQGNRSVTSVHRGLPSTCSHIQMSLSFPREPHSLWKQFPGPKNGSEISEPDNATEASNTGCICFLVVPRCYTIVKDSDLEAHGMFLPQQFDREREREENHMINDAYSVWLSGAEKASHSSEYDLQKRKVFCLRRHKQDTQDVYRLTFTCCRLHKNRSHFLVSAGFRAVAELLIIDFFEHVLSCVWAVEAKTDNESQTRPNTKTKQDQFFL